MNKHKCVFISILISLSSFFTLEAQSFLNNKVIAHRGAWKNTGVPQNSIASLKNAIKLGCTGSEFDVRMTQDEVLVICHDPQHEGLDIEKTTYADLLKKPLKNGELIPTFQQYLKAGKKQKRTFDLRRKSSVQFSYRVCLFVLSRAFSLTLCKGTTR